MPVIECPHAEVSHAGVLLLEGGARRMGLEGEVRRRERRGSWRDKARGIGLEG